ncbi:hypothetical protein VTN77DRAFT_7386 [Rasamsonia byssochlamydoides]|uniref:uncharacterized protein n=1 Tax=Rasamsonia byssochlamydoides TaxID=89139 RepID=UPI00374201B7
MGQTYPDPDADTDALQGSPPLPIATSILRKPVPYEQLALINNDPNLSHLFPTSNRKTRPSLLFILRWWLPEVFASMLSIASFLSTIILLQKYNGRGINDLILPQPFTLNGIVAALSTFNRVCLMVPVEAAISQEVWLWFSTSTAAEQSQLQDLGLSDAASRGAWGSFVFLVSVRGRRYLAYLGAIITILSLPFGTFTQQLVAIDNLVVTDPHSGLLAGNIPRSETWQDWKGNPAEGCKDDVCCQRQSAAAD